MYLTIPESQKELSAEIDQALQTFLANGGKIKQIPSGRIVEVEYKDRLRRVPEVRKPKKTSRK